MSKKVIATPLTVLALLGLLTAGGSVVGCGGASGGNRTGLGGAGGVTAGLGGSGGTTAGLGGMTVTDAGAGLGGVTTALSCSPGVDPAAALLTDFQATTWSNGAGKWNTIAHDLTGSKYSNGGGMVQADGGLATAITNNIDTTLLNPALELKGTVVAGDYGFGLLSFDACVNTTKYTGIQFTLGGTTGGCDLYLLLQTFDEQGVANKGGCTTSCYQFPRKKLEVGTAPVVVHFTDLENTGLPATAAAMKAQIVGLQWQFQSPAPAPDGGTQVSCTGIDLTIDDVQFVAD